MKEKKGKSQIWKKSYFRMMTVMCAGIFVFSSIRLVSIRREYEQASREYEQLRRWMQEMNAGEKGEVADHGVDETYDETKKLEEREDKSQEASVDESSELLGQSVSLRELQEKNADTVAWIEIPGTQVNYPVMHSGENAFYLEHTFRREKNSSGSIFVEALNAGDFCDLHTIIYGHNMKNGSMFGSLKQYRDPAYQQKHPLIYLNLPGETRVYEIFSCQEIPADSKIYTIGFAQDEPYREFLKDLKENALYDTEAELSGTEKVITLSTCTDKEDTRFVVHGKYVEQ